MRSHKYQGLGNDYLVVLPEGAETVSPALVRRLCDRHHGIGADGVLLGGVVPGDSAASLRIFNPDGSEAEKSGNGLRIFARHLWDAGKVGDQPFEVRTRGGVVGCQVREGGAVVVVDMGEATSPSPCRAAI